MATQYDIAVVGAGLSGLRTAIILRKQGKRVIVLEANDRVGGRTKGEEVTIGDHSIQYDIGGQWVGPSQERMYALLKEYSVETVHQSEDGLPYQYLHKKLYKSRTKGIPGATPLLQLPLLGIAMKYLDHLAFQVPVDKPWCATRAEEWDSYSIETWMRSSWWAGTNTLKQTVDIICWAVLATEPARVSFLWFLWFIHQVGGLKMLISTHGGAQQDRIVGGASQLSQKMADELGEDLWLSSPVELIEQDKNMCKLTLQNKRTIECSKVVIATSPALSSRIQFNPPLPGCRDALSQGHMMGHVIKTITFYNSPFWRDSGYSGEGVCDGNSVRLTFDASYDDKNIYALVGFFLGDSALQWCDRTMEERKAEVVNYYTTVFGSDAANPIHYIENNWPAEPYVRGAYMSIPPPNVLTKVGPAIREPIGNIHFAGTETATHWSGYMEGALEAAERVTNELSDISTENCPDPCLFNLHRKNRQQMVDYSRGNFFSWKSLVFGALVASAAAFVAHKNGKLNFKK